MANFGKFLQDMAQKMPGNKFAQTRLGDVLSGGIVKAINRNEWKMPSLHGDQTSIDDTAAVGSGDSSTYRNIARQVGMGFGIGGISKVAGIPGLGSGIKGGIGQAKNGNIFDASPGLMGGAGATSGTRQGNTYETMLGADPNLSNSAKETAEKGRYGDSHLLHISEDELNQLKATGKLTRNPETGLPEAFSLGGIMGPIGQMFGQNQSRQDISGIAHQASEAGNPLAASQRQPYQQQLAGMMSPGGAQNFMENDPSIQAQRRMIGDQMGATFAHSGNAPLTSIMGSAQLANAFGGQYNERINQLSTLGGFNQGNPYGGMAYGQMMPIAERGNAANMGAMGGLLGQIPGLGSMFGGGSGSMGGGGAGGGDSLGLEGSGGGFNDFTGEF